MNSPLPSEYCFKTYRFKTPAVTHIESQRDGGGVKKCKRRLSDYTDTVCHCR